MNQCFVVRVNSILNLAESSITILVLDRAVAVSLR
jgi:hypothetical protein